MKVTSKGIVDGKILDRYGSKGQDFVVDMPSLSIPFSIEDAPEGTKSFAVVFDDYDAVPVSGFCWIHWILCDLKDTEVPEGASGNSDRFTEGCNSWHGLLDNLTMEQSSRYGGPAPEDRPHEYELQVFALSDMLDLKPGYYYNEFLKEIRGKVLDTAVIRGMYSN